VKLAVVAAGDPLDIGLWSGVPCFMTQALRTRFADLLVVRTPCAPWERPARGVARRLTGNRMDIIWSRRLARRRARLLAGRLRAQGVSMVAAIGASPWTAFLAEYFPAIHVSDATAVQMRGYYPEFARLWPGMANSAMDLDRWAVQRSRACLFSSAWAAESAMRDYGAEAARVHVIPFGANVDWRGPFGADVDWRGPVGADVDRRGPVGADVDWRGPDAARDGACAQAAGETCHLVFLGVDWVRKGGDIAVAAAMALRARGVRVQLDIIGASPSLPGCADFVRVHGFVSKTAPAGREMFNGIMARADFVIVPTRKECYGLFAAEASAFGVPVIATRTGGLPGVVQDGVNGHLLPLEAGPDEYADLIAELWADQPRYGALRASALGRFRTALNWESWLARVLPVIEDVRKEARLS
jgi:glycosyltransferase involved in cell wall biosynthesis